MYFVSDRYGNINVSEWMHQMRRFGVNNYHYLQRRSIVSTSLAELNIYQKF